MLDQEDINDCARRAVQENLRHSSETLYELLCRLYPEADDNMIDHAISVAL